MSKIISMAAGVGFAAAVAACTGAEASAAMSSIRDEVSTQGVKSLVVSVGIRQ